MEGRAVGRALIALTLMALSVLSWQVGAPRSAEAQVPGFNLIALCDLPDVLRAGLRSYRVENDTDAPAPIELRNLNSGAVLTGTAPPGESFWQIQGVNGTRNTTELYVNGQFAVSKNSLNRPCAVLQANAACDPASGLVAVTWTLTSFNTLPVTIVSNTLGVTFSPNPLPAGGFRGTRSIATESIAGSSDVVVRSLDVVVDIGRDAPGTISASVTIPPCEAPLPPDIQFTFTKTSTATTAAVGETITYTYAGTNLSTVPLEVVQLVDDHLGVLLEPPEGTIVAPGDSLSTTVDYVVQPTDAGTMVVNNAVVSVRDPATERIVQGVAAAEVSVPVPPDPEPPVTTTTTVATTTSTTEPAAPATTLPPSTSGPPAPTSTSPPGALPATGAGPAQILWFGLAALALGSLLTWRGRRSHGS